MTRWLSSATALRIGLASLLLLSACDSLTYETDETVPRTELAPPEPLVIDIAAAADTLILWDEVSFQYTIDDPRPVKRVEVLFGEEIVQTYAPGEALDLDSELVQNGRYRFRIRAIVASQTGSLADRYDREDIVAESERVAIVDNAPPQPIRTTTFATVDGRLAVRWDASTRPAFQQYEVWQLLDTGDVLRATIQDRSTTQWIDSTSVGGTVRYWVNLTVGNETAQGTWTEQTFPVSEIREIASPDLTARTLTWSAAPFPANVTGYAIDRIRQSSSEDPEEIAVVTDTTFTDAIPAWFGSTFTYTIRALSTTPTNNTESGPVSTGIDRPVETYTMHAYVPSADAFIGEGHHNPDGSRDLVRLDAGSLEETGRFASSDNPQILTSPSGRILLVRDAIRILDPATMTVTHEASRPILLGTALPLINPFSSQHGYAFTDAGVFMATYGEYHSPALYGDLGYFVLDVENSQVLYRVNAAGRRPPRSNPNWNSITLRLASPDGAYALIETREDGLSIHERQPDGSFNELAPVTLEIPTSVQFINDREIVISNGRGGSIIYDVPTFQEVRRVHHPAFYPSGFDATTKVLYGLNTSVNPNTPSRAVGVNLETGETVFDVIVDPYLSEFRFMGGVIWGDGWARRILDVGTTATAL
ncbi:MAG: hypothetical protein Rubg2KO_25660 [Rubricoccaceae bacterium]